ncbi:CD63 antigen-like [Hyposmocoma kahamanoa]|uniref:CD63 antigen-like n=1 Tax=Hyposmocoma kahamanoa TaxID=1477025 RepID=UPI000E6D8B9F|nr:CD63 antigen-like [Hyposmocoma kahamanoa]
MGCGEFLVKYILFFANLFFALAGLTLLGLGIAAQVKAVDLTELGLTLAPVSSIVLGSLVFFVAFFGCCGAIRENNCMLVTYSIFMLILMILKITLATLIFVNLDGVLNQIPQFLKDSFNKDPQAFHDLESSLKCCGPAGYISYMPAAFLPDSCCASTPCVPINAYSGCDIVIKDFLNTFSLVIGSIAIAIAAVELVAVIFGLCLASHIRNKARRGTY